MLAEPKCRKLKWSSDPQNVAWANDKSKFGLKMMKRMGWEEGESLGRDGAGIKKHIELKPVIDNRGLGYESGACLESQHQTDFEEILQSLNKHYSNTKGKEESKGQTCFPIERGAAKSRPLRYRKFVQAKDLSNKTNEDLSCVFVRQKLPRETNSLIGASNISEFKPLSLTMSALFVQRADSFTQVGSEQNTFESTKGKLALIHTDVTLDDSILSLVPSYTEGVEEFTLPKKTRSKRKNKHSN